MTMKGTLSHTAVLGEDVFGNLTRMDNVLDGLPGKLEAVRAELAEKTARLKELNILLNIELLKKHGNLLVDKGH